MPPISSAFVISTPFFEISVRPFYVRVSNSITIGMRTADAIRLVEAQSVNTGISAAAFCATNATPQISAAVKRIIGDRIFFIFFVRVF